MHDNKMFNRTSIRVLGLYLLCGWGLTLPRPAQAQGSRQYTVISGSGQALYRLAIPPVLSGSGGPASAAKTLQTVMTNDMTLIGLFKVIDAKSYLANLNREGVGIVAQDWLNIGAQAVIKARVSREGSNLRAEFYLYDAAKGASPLLKKTYTGPQDAARRLAHRFGNDVVEHYTGQKGIFLSKITFSNGQRRSKKSQIYVMDYDGYGAHAISKTGPLNVLPAWSPDGRIAYTSFLWRNPDLFIMSPGGGRAQRISKHPGLNIGAAWSPRGNALAVTMSKDGNSEIYLISPSGAIIKRLTNHPAIDASPAWSPDGSQLAFVSNRGGSPQIYVMSSSGGNVRRLTFQGNYNQEPSWCPRKDTPLVAFTARDEAGAYDIFTVNVSSGEVKRLTQGQGSNSGPSWAPNGMVLVFESSRGGLWLMTAEGLNQQRIYRGGATTAKWSF
jgi:TolB protein